MNIFYQKKIINIFLVSEQPNELLLASKNWTYE